jgi:hypothetical protein
MDKFGLIVGASVIGLVVILAVGVRSCTTGPEVAREAQKEVKRHVCALYPDKCRTDEDGNSWPRITCAEGDSDRNGYVSCQYRFPGSDPVALECRGPYNFGHGCRPPRAVFVQQGQHQ